MGVDNANFLLEFFKQAMELRLASLARLGQRLDRAFTSKSPNIRAFSGSLSLSFSHLPQPSAANIKHLIYIKKKYIITLYININIHIRIHIYVPVLRASGPPNGMVSKW